MPILRDPAPPPSCDVLIIESTYGDRLHEEVGDALTRKAQQLVAHAKAHHSKIIVPAFAPGDAGTVMRIKTTRPKGESIHSPIYIDPPLASKVTDVFRKHPECYDEETHRTFTFEGDPFAARYIRYVPSPDESKRLNTPERSLCDHRLRDVAKGDVAPSETCDPGRSQHDRHRGLSG